MVISGAGAAGVAICDTLITAGIQGANMIVCDSQGIIHADRPGLTGVKTALATFASIEDASEAVSSIIAAGIIPAALELLAELHRETQVSILLATHADDVAARADRIVRMKDGQIEREERTFARMASAATDVADAADAADAVTGGRSRS